MPDVVAGVVDSVVALGSLRMISRAAMSSVETGRMGLPAMRTLYSVWGVGLLDLDAQPELPNAAIFPQEVAMAAEGGRDLLFWKGSGCCPPYTDWR